MAETAAANTTVKEGVELLTPEPLERLSKLREEAGEHIKNLPVGDSNNSPANYDVEQNIREIYAIINMNEEIFDRCMGDFMIKSWRNGEQSWATGFRRITYEKVTTRVRNDGTQVITHPIRATKEFNTTPLSKLPQGLEDIIASSNMTGKHSFFIDFLAFFQRALLLHDTVLEPFLPKLKEHLMSIQVCLGEIDAWVIQETQENVTFLEETFAKKIEIPDDNIQLGPHECSCESHNPYELCLSCGLTFCNHNDYDNTRRCPNDMFGNRNYTRFQCQYHQVLKRCHSNAGKHEMSFHISDEQDKVRLKKLLELMAMY
jgi:hypothetical protein